MRVRLFCVWLAGTSLLLLAWLAGTEVGRLAAACADATCSTKYGGAYYHNIKCLAQVAPVIRDALDGRRRANGAGDGAGVSVLRAGRMKRVASWKTTFLLEEGKPKTTNSEVKFRRLEFLHSCFSLWIVLVSIFDFVETDVCLFSSHS